MGVGEGDDAHAQMTASGDRLAALSRMAAFLPPFCNLPMCSASNTLPALHRNPIPDSQMQSSRICVALAAILLSCSFSGQAASQPKQSEIDSAADRLFQGGKFAEAGELYSRIAAQNPEDYSATLQLGRIALLSNRLGDAQKWLEEVIDHEPDDADAKVMLAEAFYRRDDFQQAAASLNGVDVSSNKLIVSQYPTLNVAKLESFKGQTPGSSLFQVGELASTSPAMR